MRKKNTMLQILLGQVAVLYATWLGLIAEVILINLEGNLQPISLSDSVKVHLASS